MSRGTTIEPPTQGHRQRRSNQLEKLNRSSMVGFWCAAIVILIVSIAVTTTIGQASVGVGHAARIIVDHMGGPDAGASIIEDGIVWDLRLPRILLAAICGAGLGVCGAVLQSLLRNPLADPFILGISSGASTGAVIIVILGVGSAALSMASGAFIGAVIAFGLVLLLAYLAGGTTERVILAGVAVTQLFAAMTSLIVVSSADPEQTRGVLFWLLGSLSNARWANVMLAGAALIVSLIVCFGAASILDAFMFGQDAAANLGISVARSRMLLLVMTALLTGAIVASAGAIGFVGLVLPHAARAIVGPGHRRLLPTTAIVGAIFLIWVDTIARTAMSPQEIPVGVVTSLVGVPVFAAILYRKRRPR